jgi:predicted site-specific integrase-resolvase
MRKYGNKTFYTMQDLAIKTGVSSQTIRNWVNKGWLPVVKLGKISLFEEAVFNSFEELIIKK